jgi:hypothetical protein
MNDGSPVTGDWSYQCYGERKDGKSRVKFTNGMTGKPVKFKWKRFYLKCLCAHKSLRVTTSKVYTTYFTFLLSRKAKVRKSVPIMGKHRCVHDHSCTYPFSRLLTSLLSRTTRCFFALLSLLSSALLRLLRPTNSVVLILIANSPWPKSASPVVLRPSLPGSVLLEPKRIWVVTLYFRAPAAGLEQGVTVSKLTLFAMRYYPLDHALQAQLHVVAVAAEAAVGLPPTSAPTALLTEARTKDAPAASQSV